MITMGAADAGYIIREIRQAKGISREELAETAGISVSHLEKIEVGLRRPGMSTYEKILSSLGTQVVISVATDRLQDQCAMKACDILEHSSETQAVYMTRILECLSDNMKLIR